MQRKRPRIGFIGAHGVGKTTLVEAVAGFLGVPVITERVREVARSWGLTPATIPAERVGQFQWWVLRAQVAAESALQEQGFVSDRSTLDNMAYYVALVDSSDEDLEAYARLAFSRLAQYDMLILIPPMFPLPQDDPERHPDPAFQTVIHETILQLVDVCMQHKANDPALPEIYVVKTEGVGNRLAELQAVVEDKLLGGPWATLGPGPVDA